MKVPAYWQALCVLVYLLDPWAMLRASGQFLAVALVVLLFQFVAAILICRAIVVMRGGNDD